ncbi:hypothetical protein DL770_005941 [Monosporascus sp. CRB-9-2]|nr:hypothetical protein DL770_005941 [Monosporascus sp. CRB-9-2]
MPVNSSQRSSFYDLSSALTPTEKSEYIDGELCLMSTPAKSGVPGAISRWDELQYAHIAQSDYIHGVPFIFRKELAFLNFLRSYWDEVADVKNLLASDIFDAELGFGGNGSGPDRCISDGPFANRTLHFREDLSVSDYCISRRLNQRAFSAAGQQYVDDCLTKDNYISAWNCLEGRPHGAGHGGVSGLMVNPLLSPGDPIFYLHHTYMDKLWWEWQSKELPKRLTEIGGNNTVSQPNFPPGFNTTIPPGSGPFTPPVFNGSGPGGLDRTPNKAFTDYFNDGGNITTLNHTLWSAKILENATIADVMDIGGGLLRVMAAVRSSSTS